METILLKILISSIYDMVGSRRNTLNPFEAKKIIKKHLKKNDVNPDVLDEIVVEIEKKLS